MFQVIRQEGCTALVNLASPMEQGKTDYVPKYNEAATEFGQVQVSNTTEQNRTPLTLNASLSVKIGEKTSDLKYFWLGNIGNRATGNVDDLLKLSQKMPAGPIMVHCKQGIGRTAMFMLIHQLRQIKEAGLPEDQLVATVMKMVVEGRVCRGYFLETEGQLNTVLKAGQQLMKLSDEQMTVQMREYLA